MVADLHFEKGSSFAARGRFLPPYDTRATLDRLAGAMRRFRPRHVVALGDSFHDRDAFGRLAPADADNLRRLVGGQAWTWIAGNHDPAPPAGLGGDVVETLAIGPLLFRHQPEAGAVLAPGTLCGHFHPKAAIVWRGRRLAAACFVSGGARLILPAFGAYAGGLDAGDPAIAGQFGPEGYVVHLIGRDSVHPFPASALDRAPRRAGRPPHCVEAP